MKKNIIVIIAVTIIIALLGVGIAIVINLPGDNTETASKQSDILLYDKTNTDAEQIIVENESGNFSFMGISYASQASQVSAEQQADSSESEVSDSQNLRTDSGFTPNDIKMHYTMQSLPDVDLDKDMMNVLAYECSYVTALQVVDKSGERYAEYGLDKPRSTVTIAFSDGSSEKIMLGNNAPDDQGIYMRREKSPNVYLAVENTVHMMLKAAYDFIDTTVTDKLYTPDDSAEGTTATSVEISGRAYKEPIKIDDKGIITSNTKYVMRSPRREVVDSYFLNTFTESLYGMEAESVVAADPTPEDIKKYGLDDPYMDILVSETDESQIHLIVSEMDDKGCLYVMNDKGNVIYRLTDEGVRKWYDLDYREILSANIVLPNPANMTGLEVTYEDTKYSFDVENTTYINDLQQEVVETKVKYDGKEMDNTRFNDYLDVITDLIRIDNCDLPLDDLTPEYTALLSYEKDDEKLTDELSVYKSSDGKYFAALNGKSEAYINAEYYEAFSRQLDRLVNGKDIENIATIYSESSDTASDASSGETSQQSEEPKD